MGSSEHEPVPLDAAAAEAPVLGRPDARTDSVPCNLCGADDPEVLFEAGVAQEGRVVRCRGCGLMYVSPRRRVELADYRERGEGEDAGWPLSPSSLERQRNQVRDYRHSVRAVAEAYPGGRVLEVGCCTGAVLAELKRLGMRCIGLEPNGWACRYAREEYGLEVAPMTLEEAAFPDDHFDAVLMLHVIEHLTDPMATLREIRRVLKPGGTLVVETPRYDTWSFELMGRRERNVVDDWHLYFYTTETLRRTLEKAGFRVVEKRVPSRTVVPSRLIGAVAKAFRLRFLDRMAHGLARTRVNSWLAFPLNIGDLLRYHAVAEKGGGTAKPGEREAVA